MSDKLITIRTFFYDHETLLYIPKLEAEGIPYLLKDQKTIAIDPLMSSALGGIRLQVPAKYAERAYELVRQLDEQHKETVSDQIIQLRNKEYEKVLEECPQCESEEVYREKLGFLRSLTQLFSRKNYYCNFCKNEWKQRYES